MAVIPTTDRCFQTLATTKVAGKQAVRTMKKRVQDRLYQRKHRAKREQQTEMLEHDVQALQLKIVQLHRNLHHCKVALASVNTQRRQQLWQPNGSLHDHAHFLVMQFFNVYQNGYSLFSAGLQERFLHSILAADVVGVDLRGVDAFVQQWRLHDQHHALYVLEPQAWKTHNLGNQSVMVEVEVMLYLRFHHQTIDMLFPSLKRGQVDSELVQPLITGTTAVAGTYTFIVDHTGYVIKLMVNLQLLETLRRVLGSLQNVVQLTANGRLDLSSGTITVA